MPPKFNFKFLQRLSIAWLLIPAIFVSILFRFFFCIEVPVALGHPDSWQYLNAAKAMVNGLPFQPEILRPNATYSYFCFFILKLLGQHTFHIALAQSVLGVLTGVIAYDLVRLVTKSRALGVVSLLVVTFRIRGLVYEHMLLAETLYDFLATLCCWTFFRYWIRPSTRWTAVVSVLCLLLYFTRGQGMIFVAASGAMILMRGKSAKAALSKVLLQLALISVPLIVCHIIYSGWNQKAHGFNGLSVSGPYNFFWVSTPNLADFESSSYSEFKEILKPCVLTSNRDNHSDLSWGLMGEACSQAEGRINTEIFRNKYNWNWGLISEQMKGFAREAIKTHPLAFSNRFFWNLHRFFWVNGGSVFTTYDLPGYFLLSHEGRVLLRFDQIDTINRYDPYYPNKAFSSPWVRFFENFLHRDAPHLRTQGWISMLQRLTFPSALVGALIFLFFVVSLNPVPYRTLQIILYGVWIAHPILTVLAVNALYDRYYLFSEALGYLLAIIGVHSLVGLTWRERGRSILIASSFIVAVVVFRNLLKAIFKKIVPIIDKPIYGLSPELAAIDQARALSNITVTLLILTGFYFIFRTARAARTLEMDR